MLVSLEGTQAQTRAGLASECDVLPLEVELANLEPQLRRAVQGARSRERDLVTELDLPAGTRFEMQGALVELDFDDPTANPGPDREIVELMGPASPGAGDRAGVETPFTRVRAGSSSLR